MSRDLIQVFISFQSRREIKTWPLNVKKDLGSVLTKLQLGGKVGFPDTKPLFTIGQGVFEIRLKEASGIFRVLYVIKNELGIVVFHCFRKKSQKTPQREIETARLRLSAYMKELIDEDENEK